VLLGLSQWIYTLAAGTGQISAGEIVLGTLEAILLGFLLGAILSFPCAVSAILLEAIIKSFARRPEKIAKALAANAKEAGRTLAQRWQAGIPPAEESFQPAPPVTPTPPLSEKVTGVFPETGGEKPE
jgi:hypothetical protein